MRKTGAGRQKLEGLAISELGNAGFNLMGKNKEVP